MDIPVLKYGEVVTVDGGRRQSFGSISGYSAQYKEDADVIEPRIARAVELGQNVVWFNCQPTIISDPPTIPDTIDHQLTDGQLVMVDSIYPEERGYWIAKRPGMMSGDNCQLVRPSAIFECQARGLEVGKIFRKLLPGEVEDYVSGWVRDGAEMIVITRHKPNEYTLSGFSEGV